MKKAFSLLALSAVASSALAQDDNWYVGLNALNTDVKQKNSLQSKRALPAGTLPEVSFDTVQTTNKKLSDLSSEVGFGIYFGKQFSLASQFALAVEAEYLSFGSFSGKSVTTVSFNGEVLGTEVTAAATESNSAKMDVSATNLNIKPKYYFSGNDFYLGAIAGIGIYKVDLKYDDGSDWGFNYGIEAGYEITPELTLSAGYRMFTTSIDVKDTAQDFELELDSFYAGLAYKF